jgi:hypothetical protein
MHSYDEKRRGRWFLTVSFVYGALLFVSIILIPIILASTKFFTISNRSRFVEIAVIFDRIDLYLQGHCLRFVDGTEVCRKLSFTEMFYRFPDYSSIPLHIGPADIPELFAVIPGQNNYVFIPLVVAELLSFVCLTMAIRAFKKTTRRSIIQLCVPTTLLMVLVAVCLGVSNKIYGEVIPSLLNKPMTVQVTSGGNTTSVTGRPTDVGIGFAKDSGGMSLLGGVLAVGILAFLINLRWIPEGKRKASVISREMDESWRSRMRSEMINSRVG